MLSSVQNEVYTACYFAWFEFVFGAILRALLVFFADSNFRPFLASLGASRG